MAAECEEVTDKHGRVQKAKRAASLSATVSAPAAVLRALQLIHQLQMYSFFSAAEEPKQNPFIHSALIH
uniref:Uncharacterized protein n=1 Tax=Setaria digitata TaxID=48799 RepID=A0A915PKJ6_9BILA